MLALLSAGSVRMSVTVMASAIAVDSVPAKDYPSLLPFEPEWVPQWVAAFPMAS